MRIQPTRAVGPQPCDYLLVSDYAGKNENAQGVPLVGKTGDEVNRRLDGMDLPYRSDIRIVNLIREWNPAGEYSEADVQKWAPQLEKEIDETQPKVIIALGRWSVRYFMGDVGVDEVQALPWWEPEPPMSRMQAIRDAGLGILQQPRRKSNRVQGDQIRISKSSSVPDRRVVFPLNNPAAGFRNDKIQSFVDHGFKELALYLAGKVEPRELFKDEFPDPTYIQVPDNVDWIRGALRGVRDIYVDSEGYPDDIWSIQFCVHPGTAYLIRLDQPHALLAFFEWMLDEKPNVTYHGSLHDFGIMREVMRGLGLDINRLYDVPFDDTQIMAYLLQLEPIGLKPNCVRHCNMRMQDYDEVLGDAQITLAHDYLIRIFDHERDLYRKAQAEEFARINRTPLRDESGKPKRTKDGAIKYRKTTVMPKLPMSELMKAARRVLRSETPYKLWQDQRDDVMVAAYNLEVK